MTKHVAPPIDVSFTSMRFIDRGLDDCAWIDGDPKAVPIDELTCCGQPALFGGVWCAHHKAIVYGGRSRC
jgi:hypothetical protein